MKALIIGATGATGKELTQQLLEDPNFDQVHIFVRRNTFSHHQKLHVHLVNFDELDSWKDQITGDIAFSCLGTTLKDAKTKEAQYKIDYTYQFEFAKAARDNGVDHFVLVSAHMADPKSKIFYSRIKGELEESIKKLNFKKISIFKPGLLDRLANSRPTEISALKAMKFLNKLGFFKKQRPMPTPILAKAMINVARNKNTISSVFVLDEIFLCAGEK